MDRNFITGLVLIFALVLGWTYFFVPAADPAAKPDATTRPNDTTRVIDRGATAGDSLRSTPADTSLAAAPADTARQAQLRDKLGAFAPAANGTAQTLRVTTDRLDLRLNTRGGSIAAAQLRQFNTFRGQPFPILPASAASGYYLQFVHNNRVIDTRELYFRPVGTTADSFTVTGADSLRLVLRAEIAPGQHLDQVYTFRGNTFDVGYRVASAGLADLVRDSRMELTWTYQAPRTEKNAADQQAKTTVHFFYGGEEDRLSPTDKDPQQENVNGQVRWVSFRMPFFAASLIAPQEPFEALAVSSTWQDDAERFVKYMTARVDLNVDHARNGRSTDLLFYLGPNDYERMEDYGVGLERQIDLGWGPIRWINEYVILFIFKQLEKVTVNYGIIIAVLALFIKIVLMPLTWRSYVSNAKMQLVNNLPEVKALDDKYKDDPVKLQNQKMAFYQSAGVSPLAGCVPLLLQLPILLAMFSFFPQSIELRGASFLWADDLSTYDEALHFRFHIWPLGDHISGFAVLMTISQILYTWISQRGQTLSGPAAQMRFLGYVFPIVFFFVLNNYSAGLSYYYFVINVLTIVQTLIIKAFIDEDKLHAKIAETRKARAGAAPKPGRLQRFLAEQQKKAEDLQRTRQSGASASRKSGPKR